MASIFGDIWKGIEDTLTGGRSSAREYEDEIARQQRDYDAQIAQSKKDYENAIKEAESKRKDTKQLYQEGKEVASAAAGNKAGLAKKNAAAAAMQGTGSRLMSAIQGAQAASDAASEGFDSTAGTAASMSQMTNAQAIQNAQNAAQNRLNAETSAAQNRFNAGTTAATNIKNSKDANRNTNKQLMATLASGWLK